MPLRRLNPPLHLLRTLCSVVRCGQCVGGGGTPGPHPERRQQADPGTRALGGRAAVRASRQRLILTPAGERYELAVRSLLVRLEAATLELVASGYEGGALQVAALPSFSAQWLVPRLADFRQRHPRITLHLTQPVINTLPGPEADCAILFGAGTGPACMPTTSPATTWR